MSMKQVPLQNKASAAIKLLAFFMYPQVKLAIKYTKSQAVNAYSHLQSA